MKKFTLTVASFLICGFLLAQDYTPPAKAVTSFENKYPDGVIQEWYEGMDDVECYFENNGIYGSAHFSQSGSWKYSEYTLDESELPNVIKEMLSEDFSGYEIADVTMMEDPKETKYTLIIYNEETEENRMVTYSASGELMDEVLITEDDDSFE